MSTIRFLVSRLAALVVPTDVGDWSADLDIDADAIMTDLQYGRD